MQNTNHQKMTVLITGVTGFIGRHLASQLLHKGFVVYGFVRNTKKAKALFGDSVRLFERIESIPAADIDVLVNLAGESLAGYRWSDKNKKIFRESRIDTTNQLFDFFQKTSHRLPLLINASAIGVYGDRGDEVLQESSCVGDDFSALMCRDWESAADRFAMLDARVCKLRFGVVLGLDGGALPKMLPAFRMGFGGRLGSGRQWMSWIHLSDLIRLIIFCIEHKEMQGVINAVSPVPVTNLDFTQFLARALHRPAVLPMPSIVLRWLIGEMADAVLLASQRVQPSIALEKGFLYEYAHIDKALSALLRV